MPVLQIFCLFKLKQKDVINPVRPPGNYELLPLICFPPNYVVAENNCCLDFVHELRALV